MHQGHPREWSKITVKPEGEVEVAIGTLSSGQGHETSFAQCVSEWLGVPFEQVKLVQGDTDIVPVGGGSHSGRSMRFAAIVMGTCSNAIIARGKRIAGQVLEADPEHGRIQGRALPQRQIPAARSTCSRSRARRRRSTISTTICADRSRPRATSTSPTAAIPTAAAVCEVEIEPDTGAVEIVRYSAVDDVGRAVNPMILHGQTHGAIAQGVGQALWEHASSIPTAGR